VKRRGLWGKHMGLKQVVIGNTFQEPKEHIGNLMGTHWEFEVNMLETNGKMENNVSLLGVKFDAIL
jgi:hypothetical protein